MPLRGRKRKGYPAKEQIAKDSEDAEEERPQQGKASNVPRAVNRPGAEATNDAIFAAGRFHDLGLAPALSDHIHGERLFVLYCSI